MVRSCGHYVAKNSFHENRLQKFFLELFWGVTGTGIFRFGNEEIELRPNTVFFYLPGDTHEIEVAKYPFEYYWLCLDGENVQNIINQFGIERRLYEVDAAPALEFELLRQQILQTDTRSEFMASSTAYHILSMVMSGKSVQNTIFDAFANLVQSKWDDSSLSIAGIARKLGVHRFTLSKIVQKKCQMSPNEYLQACRMRQVLMLIRTTSYSIKEIAYKTGYENPNYFAKAVKRRFGVSPSELREHYLGAENTP